jgi:hypothetical protein
MSEQYKKTHQSSLSFDWLATNKIDESRMCRLVFDWSHIIEHSLLRGGNHLEDPVLLFFVKMQQKGLQTRTAASRRLFFMVVYPYIKLQRESNDLWL